MKIPIVAGSRDGLICQFNLLQRHSFGCLVRLFNTDNPRTTIGALTDGHNLSANFHHVAIVAQISNGTGDSVNRVAFGDGGKINLNAGQRFLQARWCGANRQTLISDDL